ncbi:MAG TPA: hypothetical protein VFA75_17525 [Nevskia sp.]|nr:hypothetical protein [Nevskia sp.]
MRSNARHGGSRRGLRLVLVLGAGLALWSLAGIAFTAEAVHQSDRTGIGDFGMLQWKAS